MERIRKCLIFGILRKALTRAVLCLLTFLLGPTLGSTAIKGPAFGIDTLPQRKLVFGYLSSLRGVPIGPNELAYLNYGAVDAIVHGFAEPRLNGEIAFPAVNFGRYRDVLIHTAHDRGRPVLMSIGGAYPAMNRLVFASIAASSKKRAAFANYILRALRVFGYDGVDIDYEFPSNPAERVEFTLLMKEIHHCLKTASKNYIVMFGCSTGFYLDQMDWKRLSRCTDFAFYFGYDWRNPANGPMCNPGVTQWLSGGKDRIEASVRGSLDFIIGHGFPSEKLIVGLPFYSSKGHSWFTVRDSWLTNQAFYASQIHPSWMEVRIGNSWWTSPESIPRKMSAVLLPSASVLTNRAVVRGVGFWEFGHEKATQPDLSSAVARWISTNSPALSRKSPATVKSPKL